MLSKIQDNDFIKTLEDRFNKNINRHNSILWKDVLEKLQNNPIKLKSIYKMEQTGGEPDIIAFNKSTNNFIYCDCSAESPIGRRSLCYDNTALDTRKQNKPKGSALGMVEKMGVEILTEEYYKLLQTLGDFDTKTSSWIQTPKSIRELGGALFADNRYNSVFIYHNGAESYYASRGFRGLVRL